MNWIRTKFNFQTRPRCVSVVFIVSWIRICNKYQHGIHLGQWNIFFFLQKTKWKTFSHFFSISIEGYCIDNTEIVNRFLLSMMIYTDTITIPSPRNDWNSFVTKYWSKSLMKKMLLPFFQQNIQSEVKCWGFGLSKKCLFLLWDSCDALFPVRNSQRELIGVRDLVADCLLFW